MTKKCWMSLAAYIFFIAVALVAMHLFLLLEANKWVGFGVGTGIMVLSLIAFIVILKASILYIHLRSAALFLFVNGAASGIAVSSLYTYLGYAPDLLQTIYVGGMSAVLFAIYCFLTNIPLLWRLSGLWLAAFLVLVLTGGIVGICLFSKTIFTLALLLFIPFTAFLSTIVVGAESARRHLGALIFASLAALIVILIVVFIVISEGEGLEGLDGLDGVSGVGSGSGPHRRNPYDFHG